MSVFVNLPYETLLNIFKFVSDKDLIESVQLVCWDFNQVVKSNILWKPRMKKWEFTSIQCVDENYDACFKNYLNIYRMETI